MRNTKFLVLGFILSVGLLFSCNKEQMALNKLSGKWKVKSATYGGTTQELPANVIMYFTFDDCDAGTTCTVTTSQSSDGGANFTDDSSSFVLSEDGKQITSDGNTLNIDKLTKSELELSGTVEGEAIGYSMVKQ